MTDLLESRESQQVEGTLNLTINEHTDNDVVLMVQLSEDADYENIRW